MRAWMAMVVVVGACGGDSGAQPDGEVGEPDGALETRDSEAEAEVAEDPYVIAAVVPRASLIDALGRARCAFDERCGVGFVGTPAQQCITLAGTYAWFGEALARMELEGKAYDPTVMAQCLQALVARPCDEVGVQSEATYRDDGTDYFMRVDGPDWYRIPACRAALTQDGAVGSGCLYGVECASGRCSAYDDRSCGECLPADGTTCDEHDDCALDHLCDFSSNTCTQRGERGAPCRDDRFCRMGLACEGSDYTTDTLGVCAGLGAAGRACDTTNAGMAPCPLGTRCDDDVCVAVPARLGAVGDSCDATPCLPGMQCLIGEDGAATCSALGEGDACSYNNPRVSPLARYDGCPVDLVCNEAEVCATPVATGATCRSSRDCGAADFCERETKVCTTRRGEGEVCSAYPSGQECAYPFTCVGSRLFGTDDGLCGIGADPGESCQGKEDCGPDVECSSEGSCYSQAFTYFGCH